MNRMWSFITRERVKEGQLRWWSLVTSWLPTQGAESEEPECSFGYFMLALPSGDIHEAAGYVLKGTAKVRVATTH